MTDHRPLLDRRRFLVAGLGAALAACSGQTGSEGADDVAASTPSPSPASSPTASSSSSPSPSPAAAGTVDPSATPTGGAYPTGVLPTRVRIPAIDVDTPCVEVNLTSEVVEVPDFGEAGWWVQTRKPGEIGPSVIGGHVDSKSGPDVFFRLRDLREGDEVTIEGEGGESRTFVVNQDPIQVKKDERPPEVFGFGEDRPELRLITCGGDFNPNIGHYVDNIVVFAHDPTYEA